MMKVVCGKMKTCPKECGAKTPHQDYDCEPCPFDKHVYCVEVRTVFCFMGEEHEMKDISAGNDT